MLTYAYKIMKPRKAYSTTDFCKKLVILFLIFEWENICFIVYPSEKRIRKSKGSVSFIVNTTGKYQVNPLPTCSRKYEPLPPDTRLNIQAGPKKYVPSGRVILL